MTKFFGISIAAVAMLALLFPLGGIEALQDKARIITFDNEEVIKLRISPAESVDDLFFKGFAILTSDGGDGVGTLLAVTKHGGVHDSSKQVDKDDESWHAHYVELITQQECVNEEINPDGLAVNPFRISFAAPGDVVIKDNNKLVLKKTPTTNFNDINYFAFLNPANLPTDNIQTYALGIVGDGQVVSFDLSLGNHGWANEAAGIPNGVCVDNVTPINTKLVERSSDD